MKWHKVCRGAVMAGVLGLGVMQPYYDQSPMMSVAEAKEQLNCENTRQGIEAYYNTNFEQALASLNQALEAGEDTQADAYYARGLVYYQLGKYDLAVADLQKSLALYETAPGVLLCEPSNYLSEIDGLFTHYGYVLHVGDGPCKYYKLKKNKTAFLIRRRYVQRALIQSYDKMQNYDAVKTAVDQYVAESDEIVKLDGFEFSLSDMDIWWIKGTLDRQGDSGSSGTRYCWWDKFYDHYQASQNGESITDIDYRDGKDGDGNWLYALEQINAQAKQEAATAGSGTFTPLNEMPALPQEEPSVLNDRAQTIAALLTKYDPSLRHAWDDSYEYPSVTHMAGWLAPGDSVKNYNDTPYPGKPWNGDMEAFINSYVYFASDSHYNSSNDAGFAGEDWSHFADGTPTDLTGYYYIPMCKASERYEEGRDDETAISGFPYFNIDYEHTLGEKFYSIVAANPAFVYIKPDGSATVTAPGRYFGLDHEQNSNNWSPFRAGQVLWTGMKVADVPRISYVRHEEDPYANGKWITTYKTLNYPAMHTLVAEKTNLFYDPHNPYHFSQDDFLYNYSGLDQLGGKGRVIWQGDQTPVTVIKYSDGNTCIMLGYGNLVLYKADWVSEIPDETVYNQLH